MLFIFFVVHIGQLEGTVVQKTSKIKELEDEIRKLKDRLSWLESERKSLENQKESLSESQQSQLKSLERVGHEVKQCPHIKVLYKVVKSLIYPFA